MFKKICSFALIGSIAYLVRYWYIGKRCRCKRTFNGELVIITGANSGIGLSLAKELARRGATLILACRDTVKANYTRDTLISETGNRNILVEELNLASLENTANFAKRLLKRQQPIYALVNNAGIFYAAPVNTEDNFELTFQTNYLGAFLLTILLLPALRQFKGNSRIINVASEAHLNTYLFPQPEYHKAFDDNSDDRFKAYYYSKFCLVLFSYKLSSILDKSNITVHCVDPGNTETNIYRYFPLLADKFWFYLQKPIRFFVIKTPIEGAQSALHSILLKETPPFYIKNLTDNTRINYRIFNPILGEALWRISRKQCGTHLNSIN